MPDIITYEEIVDLIKSVHVIQAMEHAFIQYSNGNCVVPPVGELLFEKPKGDTHIKYGYIKDEDYFCIKIASGFYENSNLGIASNQGLMLLFSQKTGVPVAILLDNGLLTDIRTAAAGALVAKYFAPKKVSAIGIIGTGVQAKMQLQYLNSVVDCKEVYVWGRDQNKAKQYQSQLSSTYNVHIALSPKELAKQCNLIITTTPSEIMILNQNDIMPGTHLTAVGSDTAHKQELDGNILKIADIVISDSIPQSNSRGEIFQAVKSNIITQNKVIELGNALQNPLHQRANDSQITVADLTGVAVQDIMIAQAVFKNYITKKKNYDPL